jgi:hypothetical protein
MTREEYLDLLVEETKLRMGSSIAEAVIKAILRLKAKGVEIPDEVFKASAGTIQLSTSNR